MSVRICLLISDDPDDYTEFSEALLEVADNTVLMAIANVKKAAQFLSLETYIPHCIFLNLGMNGIDNTDLLASLSRPALLDVKVFAWGDPGALPANARNRVSSVPDLDVTYVELKELLRKIVGSD